MIGARFRIDLKPGGEQMELSQIPLCSFDVHSVKHQKVHNYGEHVFVLSRRDPYISENEKVKEQRPSPPLFAANSNIWYDKSPPCKIFFSYTGNEAFPEKAKSVKWGKLRWIREAENSFRQLGVNLN